MSSIIAAKLHRGEKFPVEEFQNFWNSMKAMLEKISRSTDAYLFGFQSKKVRNGIATVHRHCTKNQTKVTITHWFEAVITEGDFVQSIAKLPVTWFTFVRGQLTTDYAFTWTWKVRKIEFKKKILKNSYDYLFQIMINGLYKSVKEK